jgi:hypothetical protein
MNKPPLARRNTPVIFGLGSTSKVKKTALENAIWHTELHAACCPIHSSESGVSEQPVGEHEILKGAINRAMSAWRNQPEDDCYIAMENGIEETEDGRWLDYAIVLAFIPKSGQMVWVPSEAVEFPLSAVALTYNKPGGFQNNTVGKTLKDLDLVRFHDDPHLDLVGKSRRDILKDAMLELFNYLPQRLWLPE